MSHFMYSKSVVSQILATSCFEACKKEMCHGYDDFISQHLSIHNLQEMLEWWSQLFTPYLTRKVIETEWLRTFRSCFEKLRFWRWCFFWEASWSKKHANLASHLLLTAQVYVLPPSAFTLRLERQKMQCTLLLSLSEAAEPKRTKDKKKICLDRLAWLGARFEPLHSYRIDSTRLVHAYLFCSRISTVLWRIAAK